jgi:outer membrane lipoprotein-sorting protein
MTTPGEPIDLPALVALLYRADWTRLSLSAGMRWWRDNEVRHTMYRARAESIGSVGPWLRHTGPHPQPPDVEWPEDEPPIEEITGTVLLAPGGRYRVEVTDERGTTLTVCDGQSRWRISDGVAERAEAGGPPGLLGDLLTPSRLLTGSGLELTGNSMVDGRAAYRVVIMPRPENPRRSPWFDQASGLADAELGILLSYQEMFGGQELNLTELTDVRLDPPGAAEPGQFQPPPGLPVTDAEPRFAGNYAIPGVAGQVARLVAGPAAAAVGFAARHAPMPSPGGATQEAIPAAGRVPRTRLEPVGDDLVNLLHRTGLPPLAFTAEVHQWADQAAGIRLVAAAREKLPPFIDGIAGPDQLWDALADRTQGTTHRVTRLTVAMPDKYRIDRLAGARSREPTTTACDGERLWKVYPNRVAAGPAEDLPREFGGIVDRRDLLSGWALSAAGEAEVAGRRGYLVAVAGGNLGLERSTATRDLGWLSDYVEIVIDAELGIVLQETTYDGDDVASLTELRDVSSQVDPGAFRVEVGPRTRTVGVGPLSDLDLPGPVKAAKAAVGLGVAGAAVGFTALAGWLQKRPAGPKRPAAGDERRPAGPEGPAEGR